MIEKLKVVLKPEDWNLPVNELEMRCLKNLLLKIDELVDAVNNQQIQLNNHECRLLDLQNQINEHDQEIDDCAATISKMENVEPTENVPEPTKWLGKLCKFWDGNEQMSHLRWGILYTITPTSPVPFCCSLGDGKTFDYEHCEPVTPDDGIIYKGE